MFGWKNSIGKRFKFAFDANYFTVIGVINDFHFRSEIKLNLWFSFNAGGTKILLPPDFAQMIFNKALPI